MIPTDAVDWMALRLLPGLGPVRIRRALEVFSDPGAIAFRLSASDLREIEGFGQATADAVVAARPSLRRSAEAEVERAVARGLAIVPVRSPDYPAILAELPDAPTVLFVRGALSQDVVRVAIVGSRRATAYGRRVASRLARGLADVGVEIVSGGARGIDACAHRACLAAGGRTIAVLGSGFGRLYPPEHEDLFDEISARGAVVSEFLMDEAPLAQHFPRRNRVVSGLAAAVVVVEATTKSGSLTTAGHALDQGREVLAVPGPVTSEQSEGCHLLLRQGAKLVERVDDLLEELPPPYREALSRPKPCEVPEVALGPDERVVLALFDDPEPVHVDRLADRAPFGIARLQAALFGLVLKGSVDQMPGGYYLAAPKTAGK